MTKLTAAASNNRFHYGQTITAKGKRERGERIIDNGDGTETIMRDGRFVATVQKYSK